MSFETSSITSDESSMTQNIMPPEPPSALVENHKSGDFSYLKSKWEIQILSNAFQAITLTESWNFMKKPIDSYSMSGDPQVRRIYNKMEELGYHGHSGCSFGCTMRDMQYIAQHGEKAFMTLCLSQQKQEKEKE